MFQFSLFFLSTLLLSFCIRDSSSRHGNDSGSSFSSSFSSSHQNSRPSMRIFHSRLWKNFVQYRNPDAESRGFHMPFGRRKRTPSTSEVIRGAGFLSEIHTVTTEDGYILTIDRIPGKPKEENNSAGNGGKKPAVLLFSSLMTCGDSWLINSPEKSLPLLLVERNFDVWLANPRGCAYSRKHKWKNPNSPEFWNFSWHEMGIYDLSAMIDHILAETGHSKLNYIGHSLGTTAQFVLLSEKPEYNQKLNMSINLGPAVFVGHVKSPIIKSIAQMSQHVSSAGMSQMLTGGSGELWSRTAQALDIYRTFCLSMDGICWAFTFASMGFDHCQHDRAITPRYLQFVPAGTSINTVHHYLQLVNNGLFRQFDFGAEENRIRYQNPSPPNYNLSNVESPQTIFYSDGDWLVHSKDAKRTASEFSPKARVMMCRVKFSSFNHLDFILAKDVNLLVNDRILRVLHGDSCWANDHGNEEDKDEESIKCPPENPMMNSESVNRALNVLNRWIAPNLQEPVKSRIKTENHKNSTL